MRIISLQATGLVSASGTDATASVLLTSAFYQMVNALDGCFFSVLGL